MNKKMLSAVILFAMILLCPSGCQTGGEVPGEVTVRITEWNEFGGSSSEPVTYFPIQKGELLYDDFDSSIKVRSVNAKKLVLDIDGYLVEPNEDGTINMQAEPLKKVTLEKGRSIQLVTLSMDAGSNISISFE